MTPESFQEVSEFKGYLKAWHGGIYLLFQHSGD
jgi:hypothetical protein